MHTKINNGKGTLVALYVDDFLVFCNGHIECNNLKSELSSKFKLKNLGQVKNWLGNTVVVDKWHSIIEPRKLY